MVGQKFKIGNKLTFLCATVFLFSGCALENSNTSHTVPEHDKRYGIYSMEIVTDVVELIYSSDNSLHRVHENSLGTKLVFQEDFGDDMFEDGEICLVNSDGSGYQRITDNTWLDTYPSWSPDGTEILFLSWTDYPDNTLDIFANKRAAWIVANIKQQIGWPQNNTLIEFRDCPLLLLPETDILLPGIAFRQERSFSGNEARTMINHYLSSLAWVEGRSLHVIGWSGGGPHPFRWAKSNLGSIVTSTFHHKYLPDPSKKKIRIALALYREALSLEHVAYSFLSYYKIINCNFA